MEKNRGIPVEISARHVHLSEADFIKLFGRGKSLVPVKELSQPGEFASEEKVILSNADKRIENIRILGPFRKGSQVEISLTDAYNLKLNPLPKIKVSGDTANAVKIMVKGPKSSIKIPCIIAQRHLHLSSHEAKKLKIKDNQRISIKIKGIRETTFHNIIARISDNYRLSLHLDTDEGNSAGVYKKIFGELIR
jgi:propanediol utilization protein